MPKNKVIYSHIDNSGNNILAVNEETRVFYQIKFITGVNVKIEDDKYQYQKIYEATELWTQEIICTGTLDEIYNLLEGLK